MRLPITEEPCKDIFIEDSFEIIKENFINKRKIDIETIINLDIKFSKNPEGHYHYISLYKVTTTKGIVTYVFMLGDKVERLFEDKYKAKSYYYGAVSVLLKVEKQFNSIIKETEKELRSQKKTIQELSWDKREKLAIRTLKKLEKIIKEDEMDPKQREVFRQELKDIAELKKIIDEIKNIKEKTH